MSAEGYQDAEFTYEHLRRLLHYHKLDSAGIDREWKRCRKDTYADAKICQRAMGSLAWDALYKHALAKNECSSNMRSDEKRFIGENMMSCGVMTDESKAQWELVIADIFNRMFMG